MRVRKKEQAAKIERRLLRTRSLCLLQSVLTVYSVLKNWAWVNVGVDETLHWAVDVGESL
jgi:hypothetical protein